MKYRSILTLIAAVLTLQTAAADSKPGTTLGAMPAQLETQFALSALPSHLREGATVYLLDPKSGYRVTRQGTNGLSCLVERTMWEMEDYRDDIYIPLCYDAAGFDGHFKSMIDAAELRAQGLSPTALKAEVEKRYRDKTYRAPQKPGLSYMVAPVMRAHGPPDLQVRTMAMPHLMFYAPFATNKDIAAQPNLADRASLAWPFVDRQGHDQQTYMIQMVGDNEKAQILDREKALVDALCEHRQVLCLTHQH